MILFFQGTSIDFKMDDMLTPEKTYLTSNISSTTNVYPYSSTPNSLDAFPSPSMTIQSPNSSNEISPRSQAKNQTNIIQLLEESRLEKLKQNEMHLNQLNSINISRYSYPNE